MDKQMVFEQTQEKNKLYYPWAPNFYGDKRNLYLSIQAIVTQSLLIINFILPRWFKCCMVAFLNY